MEKNKIAYMPEGNLNYKNYMFLASKLRYRSQHMLTRDRLEQMLDSGSLETAEALLADSGWPNFIGLDEAAVDEALSKRREQLFNEIESVIPEDQVIDIFRIKYDYHNAKAIIKGEASGTGTDGLLSGAGRVAPKALESAYLENDYRAIPEALGKAMSEAKGVLAGTGNPQLSDVLLDRACFAEMAALAAEVIPDAEISPLLEPEAGIPFMQGYVSMLIDRANLSTCVRCVRAGKDLEFLRAMLIPGGSVSAAVLGQYGGAADTLAGLFDATPLKEAGQLGAAAMRGGPLSPFEKECDNAINRWLANIRMMKFGAELVTWYLAAEETNITSVRMIIKGLKYGIAPAIIKERLRETYA